MEKLDLVLNTLATNEFIHRDVEQIHQLIPPNGTITGLELGLILSKFVRDSMAESYMFTVLGGGQKPIYKITFEGSVFIEQGGYVQAQRTSEIRQALDEARIQKGEQAQNRLNILTFWLVLGSIAVAVVEIVKLILGK